MSKLCAWCNKVPARPNKVHCTVCAQRSVDHNMKKYLEYKRIIYNFYGNVCACCKETEIKFLTIDHINNDGNIQRKKTTDGGRDFYRNLANLILEGNPPTDLQLLCRNCNWGKHVNGGVCPHISKYMEG